MHVLGRRKSGVWRILRLLAMLGLKGVGGSERTARLVSSWGSVAEIVLRLEGSVLVATCGCSTDVHSV